MNQPQFLKKGATIGITCPSGYVSADRVAYCINVFENHGYYVKLGKTIGTEHFYFSGTDTERLEDLQSMLDDREIDAIFMGRGGYGMSRIVDALDFTAFLQNPKWICGFSDITVLHSHIQANFGIATLHSPMSGHFKPETENAPFLQSFFTALKGKPLVYTLPSSIFNRSGAAEGVLTGGNLALLCHLIGSDSEVNTDGKILFLEDVGEYLYNIDRMMVQLKRAGKLNKLAGLIFGSFTDIKDTERPFGQTIEQLLWDKVKEYNYPVCFNFPCGHQDINYTLTLGVKHKIVVNVSGSFIEKI